MSPVPACEASCLEAHLYLRGKYLASLYKSYLLRQYTENHTNSSEDLTETYKNHFVTLARMLGKFLLRFIRHRVYLHNYWARHLFTNSTPWISINATCTSMTVYIVPFILTSAGADLGFLERGG